MTFYLIKKKLVTLNEIDDNNSFYKLKVVNTFFLMNDIINLSSFSKKKIDGLPKQQDFYRKLFSNRFE